MLLLVDKLLVIYSPRALLSSKILFDRLARFSIGVSEKRITTVGGAGTVPDVSG